MLGDDLRPDLRERRLRHRILDPGELLPERPGEVLVVEGLGTGLVDAAEGDPLELLRRGDGAAGDPVAAGRRTARRGLDRGCSLLCLEPRRRGGGRRCQPALDEKVAPCHAKPGHVVLLGHVRIVVHVVTHAVRSFLMACCMTGTPSCRVHPTSSSPRSGHRAAEETPLRGHAKPSTVVVKRRDGRPSRGRRSAARPVPRRSRRPHPPGSSPRRRSGRRTTSAGPTAGGRAPSEPTRRRPRRGRACPR